MEWVPLDEYDTGINLADRPRKLTEEEITYITDHLPLAPSADSVAAEIARMGTVEWMIETLREVSIAPSAIPELIQSIIEQHNKSLVVPGTPVGITAAEAVGATTTQMTLNSVAPWERILIQEQSGESHLLKIGDWIDALLLESPSDIQHIPENRTEYLSLSNPVFIATPNKYGEVSWDEVTAVTRHLPVGDMVRVITQSGCEVTATQSKSLLVWNGFELIQTEGKNVKVGDKVPVISNLSDLPTIISTFDGIELTYEIGTEFGEFLMDSSKTDKYSDWVSPDNIIDDRLLSAPKKFLEGLLSSIDSNISINNDLIKFAQRRLSLVQSDINDVMLDPIVSVELVPATEYVYDLTVPTTTNFSLWNGLGIADTFHSSGSAKSASFGIEAMRDLIFARKNPKNESCTIYFTDKQMSFEDVLDSRHYIVGSVVSDFIKDYDIDNPDALERFWWHEDAELFSEKPIPTSTKVLRLYLNVSEMYKQHVTIKQLADVLERELPPSAISVYGPIGDGIIDVYPHPAIIAETLKGREKGVIPIELAELTYLETVVWPELKNIRVKGISGIKTLSPVTSPVWRMVLSERKMVNSDITVEAARPILEPYINNGDGWLLYYNPSIMKLTGLQSENLAALCQLAGVGIIGGTETYLAISMPYDRFRTENGTVVAKVEGQMYAKLDNYHTVDGVNYKELEQRLVRPTENGWTVIIQDPDVTIEVGRDDIHQIDDKYYMRIVDHIVIERIMYEKITDQRVKITELKPNEYVIQKVTSDKRARSALIKQLTDEAIARAQQLPEQERKAIIRKPAEVPRTPLMIASEFVIAETEGSNLKELLALPNIDKTRTTCNNMFTIAETLGIEAARTFLIRALYNTISNTGSYVHPANIMFIAEFITNRGEPYGATYTGISRQSGGHLSLATLERAGMVFTKNALHGRKEDIRNVSASVAVGTRMTIGDGAFDIAQDIIENGVPVTVINDDLFTSHTRNDNVEPPSPARVDMIGLDDLAQGIEDIKTITLGGTFDYVGAEDETNLITAFNPGEFIPELHTTRQTQPRSPKKIVRRVNVKTEQPVLHADIPQDLVDVLTQIKIGVPLPEGEEVITIKPLQTGVNIQQQTQKPLPIVSTGLVPLEELLPRRLDIGIPDGLNTLFDRYNAIMTEDILETEEVPVVVQELPRVEIPELPALTGTAFTKAMIDLRREQINYLEPINTEALQTALNK